MKTQYVVLDRIAVKEIKKPEKKTPGGIIIPETISDREPIMVEVVHVGNGRHDEEMQAKPGDIVYINKLSGTKLKDGDDEYRIIIQSEILFGLRREE